VLTPNIVIEEIRLQCPKFPNSSRTIKRQLKLQGKTYRDVAAALQLSEAPASSAC
jgi:hypothetical protein